MSRETRPVFLVRRTYRRRRLADAARMLPLLGAALFCLPLLWARTGADAVPTSYVMTFIFLVWVGLIVVGGCVSARLHSDADDTSTHRDE